MTEQTNRGYFDIDYESFRRMMHLPEDTKFLFVAPSLDFIDGFYGSFRVLIEHPDIPLNDRPNGTRLNPEFQEQERVKFLNWNPETESEQRIINQDTVDELVQLVERYKLESETE